MGRIGVFDSGFGGLSILKEMAGAMPEYSYIYIGDSARAPYGEKSQDTIYEYTREGVDFLFARGAEIVVLACNTASSEALRKIQQEYLPAKYPGKRVLGVIIPACEDAVLRTKNKKIGVLGTEATVASHAFKRELQKLDPEAEVFEVPAPLLVPLVEAGEEESESAKLLTKEYVERLPKDIDTLILGCTHYGYFESEIRSLMPGANIISEGKVVGGKLKDYLKKHSDIEAKLSKDSNIEFFTTDSPESFDLHGSRFFGQEIKSEKADL